MSRELVDSGVYYLGKIPTNWKIGKYKFFSKSRMGETILSSNTANEGIPVYSATQEDKIFGYVRTANVILHNGDLVIPARGNSIGCVSYIKESIATCTQTTICSTNIKNINNKYCYYTILGLNKEWFKHDGAAIPQITVEQVKNNILALPPLDEQTRIANYLDEKCSKIDEIINDNNKEIKLMEEYKNNILNDFFNGIKDNSKNIKLKYLGKLINGISAGIDKFENGEGTFINYGDVYNNIKIPEYPNGKVDLTEKEIEIYSLKKGDILFTRTSETIEEVGFSSVCGKDYPKSAFSGFVIRFRPNNQYYMNPEFYKYYFKLKQHRDFFAREMNIVTRASLSQNLLGNINVILPCKEIQDSIAIKIDYIYKNIDNIISYRKQIIEKLEEYKKSLIYEVVTGKKEV